MLRLRTLIYLYAAVVVADVLVCLVLVYTGEPYMIVGPIVAVNCSGLAVGIAIGKRFKEPVDERPNP